MSDFAFVCPFCNQRMDCDESLENQKAQCPSCNRNLILTKEDCSETAPQKKATVVSLAELKAFNDWQKEQNHKQSAAGSSNDNSGWVKTNNPFYDKPRALFAKHNKSNGVFYVPFLSCVFYWLGILGIIAAVLMFLNVIISIIFDGFPMWEAVSTIVITQIVCIIHAFISFGVAEMLYFIGKICYNSDCIAEKILKDHDSK